MIEALRLHLIWDAMRLFQRGATANPTAVVRVHPVSLAPAKREKIVEQTVDAAALRLADCQDGLVLRTEARGG